MAQIKSTSSDGFPWVPFYTVVVGLVASGLLIIPLTSSRPNASLPEGDNGMSLQDVDARLWQDPLKPVFAATHSASGAGSKSETNCFEQQTHSLDQLKSEFFRGTDDRMILAVMVNGSAYAEKVERRLRDRVAVANAFGRAGYAPKDAEHLGYFSIPWSRTAENGFTLIEDAKKADFDCGHDGDCVRLTVPFEEYKHDATSREGKKYDKVLILWLRQDFFSDKPLVRLAQLLSQFETDAKTRCPIKILGPDSSDSLLSIVQEVKAVCDGKSARSPWSKVGEVLKDVEMFAFRPSASDDILLQGANAGSGRLTTLINESCIGLKLYRTTIADNVLFKTLFEELKRRDIKWQPDLSDTKSDAVALISEQDTFFGRAYPETFKSLVKLPPSVSSSNIEVLSYLRGIDGRTPTHKNDSSYSSSDSKSTSRAGDDSAGAAKQSAPRERPEGTDQSDYIRRLATQISVLDELRGPQTRKRRGIAAIGVLGSDVYDKLEILHALRSRSRAKLFFTVGLDARFYHPDELRATHNLVVVSAFGLRLHRFYQGSVLSFRDHNQTAAFASALCALGLMSPQQIEKSKPRIFEISTKGPIDLSIDREKKSDLDELEEASPPNVAPSAIHPGRPDLREIDVRGLLHRFGVLAILLASVIFVVHSIWGGDKTGPPALFRRPFILAISSFVVVILVGLMMWLYHAQRVWGEPFNVLAGASMWPTEFIRLCVIMLSGYFLLESIVMLNNNLIRDIQPQFGLANNCKQWPGLKDFFQTLRLWKHAPKPDITKLWREYLLRDCLMSRIGRSVICLVVYLIAVLLWWSVCRRPISPVRGHTMAIFDYIINWTAMGASTFLTIFVATATSLDARFALRLSKGETTWPEDVRNRHRFNSDKDAKWESFNGDYLDLLLIATRTRAVTRLIYYPFITIALLILCRLPQFDNFDWPPVFVAVFSFNVVISCACVWVLRKVAERARRESLSRLRKKLQKARVDDEGAMQYAIQKTIKEIEKLDTGIFARVTRQPIIGALLLPSGSAAIWAIMQYVL